MSIPDSSIVKITPEPQTQCNPQCFSIFPFASVAQDNLIGQGSIDEAMTSSDRRTKERSGLPAPQGQRP
jgi:hypothetical protein